MTDEQATAAVMGILSAAKVSPLPPDLDLARAARRFKEEVEGEVLRERARTAAEASLVLLADLDLIDAGD